MDSTAIVNESLVKLDNVVNAANYLLEEIQTRQQQLFSRNNLLDEVKEVINDIDFKSDICHYVKHGYGSDIVREVAFYVMAKIDSDIEAFINDRVNKAISAAGIQQHGNDSTIH